MATQTISGNVGGVSGATINLQSLNGSVNQLAGTDSSGNYSFTVPDLTSYILTAFLPGYSIRQRHEVFVNGASVSNINFQVFNLTDSSNNPSF
jgi:hypothetical protein